MNLTRIKAAIAADPDCQSLFKRLSKEIVPLSRTLASQFRKKHQIRRLNQYTKLDHQADAIVGLMKSLHQALDPKKPLIDIEVALTQPLTEIRTRQGCKLKAYMSEAARNEMLDRKKDENKYTRRRKYIADVPVDPEATASESRQTLDYAENFAEADRTFDLILSLCSDELDRRIVELRATGLSVSLVADQLGHGETTIRDRLSSLKAKLAFRQQTDRGPATAPGLQTMKEDQSARNTQHVRPLSEGDRMSNRSRADAVGGCTPL